MSNAAVKRTLSGPVTFEGAGLHSGEECRVVLHPAAAGAGIVFHRQGHDGDARRIFANPASVVRARHGTCLANSAGVSVSTVEHLLAALALTGVDDAAIEVDGPEIPIMDGSAAAFVSAIAQTGVAAQAVPRCPIVIMEAFEIADEDRLIRFEPHDGRRVEIEIDFGDCLIGRQTLSLDLENPEDLVKLSAARTFVRLHEVEPLRAAGLIRGGTLSNAIVVDGDRLLNDEPLRDPAEFALHKALDLIGDLYLAGAPIIGLVSAVRPGHEINTRAAARLAALSESMAAQSATPALDRASA